MTSLTSARPTKRQLLLPNLPRPATAKPPKRARRDLTAIAFTRALTRNGFQPARSGTHFVNIENQSAEPVAGVFRHGPLRLDRRATLARIARTQMSSENSDNGAGRWKR